MKDEDIGKINMKPEVIDELIEKLRMRLEDSENPDEVARKMIKRAIYMHSIVDKLTETNNKIAKTIVQLISLTDEDKKVISESAKRIVDTIEQETVNILENTSLTIDEACAVAISITLASQMNNAQTILTVCENLMQALVSLIEKSLKDL